MLDLTGFTICWSAINTVLFIYITSEIVRLAAVMAGSGIARLLLEVLRQNEDFRLQPKSGRMRGGVKTFLDSGYF